MAEEKKLYPLKFLVLSEDASEQVQLADLGYQDSEVRNGWLAANTLSEIMEMYMDRVVGESAFGRTGRQFPILLKTLHVQGDSPLLVHPNDEIAAQRFDALGKEKCWYIVSAKPGAKVYLGFREDITAAALFEGCTRGGVEALLRGIEVHAGDFFPIRPGVVHAASGELVIAEVAECSPLDFRLYNWGRPLGGDDFDASLNLEAAFDFIDLGTCFPQDESQATDNPYTRQLLRTEGFSVTEVDLKAPLHVKGNAGSFLAYLCLRGEAAVEADGTRCSFAAGEAVLVPAEVDDFSLFPLRAGTLLLETAAGVSTPQDPYLAS